MTTAADAHRVLAEAFDGDEAQERFMVLHLDNQNKPMGVHDVSRGGPASAEVPVASVLGGALVAGARSIILAHNHPSCELSPSGQDREITERLADAGAYVGVKVLDHLTMCGKGDFRSMQERGDLPNTRLADYAPPPEDAPAVGERACRVKRRR